MGLGLRFPHIQTVLSEKPDIPWFELLTDNWMAASGVDGVLLDAVLDVYPVALHGVAMNIGGVDPLNRSYIEGVKALADRCETPHVSDHLCFTAVQGEQLHDLAPLPLTDETLSHVADRIDCAQNLLKRRLTIENISAYMSCKQDTYTDAEFLNALAKRTGCGLLLDINNLYVNQFNLGRPAQDCIHSIRPEFVTEFHLGGFSDQGEYLLDAHDHPVCDAVLDLYQEAVRCIGNRPTLIEWDHQLPAFSTLMEEKVKVETCLERTDPIGKLEKIDASESCYA